MEHERELRELLVHSADEFGINLNGNQVAQFMCYLSQLTRWNESINLTSITGFEDIVIKHFIDSLTGLNAVKFPENSILADVGTGGGFPGIPLKIARSDLKLVLIEPNRKKCSFLASVVGQLRLQDVDVFQGSIQGYADATKTLADVVTVRALRFDEIKRQILRLITSTGLVILYGTAQLGHDEIGNEFMLQAEKAFSLPRKSGKRVVSVLARKL